MDTTVSRIGKDLRYNVRQNVSIPAIVVDYLSGKASIKLGNTGALMRNLDVVGGPVKIGDRVRVDFTTSKPTVIAVGQEGLSLADVMALLAKSGKPGYDGTTQITITLFSGGAVKKMYDPTPAGLQAALLDATSGDVVFIPDADLTCDASVGPGIDMVGVSSRETIIRGQVTFEPGCLLENLSVINQGNSAGDIIGVLAFTTIVGLAHRIKGCEIGGYNCGGGAGIGVSIDSSDDILVVENSTIMGDSKTGFGYAFSNDGGDVRVDHSKYYAKTEVFHDI
jgi:hypothetical protein